MGKAGRGAVTHGHAKAAAEHTEDGGLARDPHIGPEGDTQPAGHRMAFDGGDDRFRARFRQRAIGTRPRAIDRALVRHLAEVCPSAEDTARSGQDHGLHFVVSLDCMDGFQEIISRLLVERVPLLLGG